MKLIKTDIPSYYYQQNKNGITYYYSYKDKTTKQSKRKKIFSCKEHNVENLKHSISITEDILKSETTKQILTENNDNIDETIKVEHFTLNEIIDIHHKRFYDRKVRELKELHSGLSEEEFNNNVIVKKNYMVLKDECCNIIKMLENQLLVI